MNQKRIFHRLFRRTAVLLSLLAILTSSIFHVDMTWAWFQDNAASNTFTLGTASFRTDIQVLANADQPLQAVNGMYTLEAGNSYTIRLTPAPGSNASAGYVQIMSTDMTGGGMEAQTTAFTRSGNGYVFDGQTQDEDSFSFTMTPSEETQLTFYATWGIPISTYSLFGSPVICHGDSIDQYGDPVTIPEPTEETVPETTEETVPETTEETVPETTEETIPETTEETVPETTEETISETTEETIPETTEETVPETTEETVPETTEETVPETTEETIPETTEETVPETTEETVPETTEETVPETTEETIPETTEETAPETTEEEAGEPVLSIPSPGDSEEVFRQFQMDYYGFVPGEMPHYYQTDYPDVRYGAGTIETSGCGIVSLAMVASYLTEHMYLPDQLADYFGGAAENNIARLEYASDTLQLPWTKAENIHYTMAALEEGKVVIALMEGYSGNCSFTQSQHFIVLKGMTEDGKILVHDPFKPNYDKWDLKDGFENGFTQEQIMAGYSGGWIYDPAQMPEEPFIYEEVKPYVETRYPTIDLTKEEQDLLARVIWVEARGECAEGQQAVAEVVLNRLASGLFGDTLHDVIYAEGQFRSVPFLEDAEPYQAQYDALEDAITGPYILPIDVYYFATEPTNDKVWGEIGGHIFCYAPDKE